MSTYASRSIRLKLWHERPTCVYCGRNLRRKTVTLDHLLPLSQGGTDDESNCVLACATCNQAKDNRSVIEWVADILAAAAAAGVLR